MKYLLLFLALLFSSCETMQTEREGVFKINTVLNQEPYSRVANKDLISRLSLALINGSNKKTYHQTSEDSGFGTFNIKADEGDYQLIVVGHNGNSTATINSDKITFGTGNKITDTFLYNQNITVKKETEKSIELNRCVAAIQIIPTDITPDELKELKFYYTGGSSTLHPDGYGCVNSKQTEYRNIGDNYLLFTFPKNTEETVTLTISDPSELYNINKTITNIPIKVGYITKINIPIFDGVKEVNISDINVGITINNTEWEVITYQP